MDYCLFYLHILYIFSIAYFDTFADFSLFSISLTYFLKDYHKSFLLIFPFFQHFKISLNSFAH